MMNGNASNLIRHPFTSLSSSSINYNGSINSSSSFSSASSSSASSSIGISLMYLTNRFKGVGKKGKARKGYHLQLVMNSNGTYHNREASGSEAAMQYKDLNAFREIKWKEICLNEFKFSSYVNVGQEQQVQSQSQQQFTVVDGLFKPKGSGNEYGKEIQSDSNTKPLWHSMRDEFLTRSNSGTENAASNVSPWMQEFLARFFPYIEYEDQIVQLDYIMSSVVKDEKEREVIHLALVRNSTLDSKSRFLILSRCAYLETLNLLDVLCFRFCPRLRNLIRVYDIALNLKWFESFFQGTLPFESCVLRIVDCFLYEGCKVLIRVALSILMSIENDLVNLITTNYSNQVMDRANGTNKETLDAVCEYIVDVGMRCADNETIDSLIDFAFSLPLKRENFSDIIDVHFIYSLSIQGLLNNQQRVDFDKDDLEIKTVFSTASHGKEERIKRYVDEGYRWIGFDLDHTLIEYNNDAIDLIFSNGFVRTVFEANDGSYEFKGKLIGSYQSQANEKGPLITKALLRVAELISEGRYQSELFSTKDGFMIKGAVIDIAKGNIMKLTASGQIDKGYHGLKSLGPYEILKEGYIKLEKSDITADKRFVTVQTCFERITLPVFAMCVEAIDDEIRFVKEKQQTPLSEVYNDVYQLCFNHLQNIFLSLQSRFCTYGTYAAFRDPALVKKLVYKQPEVKEWLINMKNKKGVKLFMVTNAKLSHVYNLMTYAYGKDWHDLFDLVVVNAKKKSKFFDVSETAQGNDSDKSPTSVFDQIDFLSELSESDIQIDNIPRNKFVSGGHVSLLMKKMEESDGPKILYFGDNLAQDVAFPRRFGWDTVAVVTELDTLKRGENSKRNRSEKVPKNPQIINKDDIMAINKLLHDDISKNLTLGSPFKCLDGSHTRLSNNMMRNAKLSIPSLKFIACQSLKPSKGLIRSTLDSLVNYFDYGADEYEKMDESELMKKNSITINV